MNSVWKPRLVTLATLAIMACSLVGPTVQPMGDVATIVASTLGAATTAPQIQPAATSGVQGIPVTFNGGALVIPQGLATGVTSEAMPAVSDQSGAPWDVTPAYTRLTLQGYPLQGAFFQPQIMIYPASDYAAASQGAAQSIQRLQAILASPSAPLTKDALPRLPYANASQIIAAQTKLISLGSGQGVRTLTEYAQYVAPINNHDIFYHFEGLTADGKWYIVTTLSINAPLLAANADPGAAVPADGVSFPGIQVTDSAVFDAYYKAITDKLNAASPDAFQPSLTLLDQLLGSLEVTQ